MLVLFSIAPNSRMWNCQACPAGQTSNSAKTACVPIPSGKPKTVKKRAQVCESGMTACPLPNGRKGFECVDTSSNVNSCGGCWATGEGEDCTVFDDMAEAQCIQGKCQCKRFFPAAAKLSRPLIILII